MTDIFLIDYIGVHCGMHYYLDAFKKVLTPIPGVRVRIASNFCDADDEKPLLCHQYRGSKLNKGFSLLRNFNRVRRLVKKNPNAVFVYLSYGNWIDEIFMRIVAKAHHHVIDIHEAIAQNVDSDKGLDAKFHRLYRDKIRNIIYHSPRTADFLNKYEYEGKRFFVPHFKYAFPKQYDASALPEELTAAVKKDRINLLFFGNLNESKGVDRLIEAVNSLDDASAERLNVIIAGKDFDGAVYRVKPHDNRSVHIFARHISDDELRFLYQAVDYLALPYRKTSQSGILEMAFYFRRPIIASDVTYFRKTLGEFPSFGVLAGNTTEDYAKTLAEVIASHGTREYFAAADYARYENRAEVADFRRDFAQWLGSR